ncbi:MAG: twin-arginine translocase subunit TatC [Anaerolineales bacterium]|nr:MAG: twin-arginine translocase subunit TatC [Anaerolineales bacterium]
MRKFFLGVGKALTFPSRAIRSIIAFFRAEPTEQPLGEMLASIPTSREFRDAILEQFEAFRKHLLRALLALILATIAGWFLTEPVIALLAGPVGGPERLQIIDLTESIGVFMKIAVLLGLAISIPYIAFEFWLFAAPGLKPRARLTSLVAIPITALLFYLGILFTYRYMLPPAINFLINFGEFQANPTAEKYYNLLTRLLLWIGLFFEFPLVVYILTSMGVVQPKALAARWRLAVIVIAVIAAVITPTTDMGSMALVMAPMIVLYFISIGLSFAASAARNRRAPTTGES